MWKVFIGRDRIYFIDHHIHHSVLSSCVSQHLLLVLFLLFLFILMLIQTHEMKASHVGNGSKQADVILNLYTRNALSNANDDLRYPLAHAHSHNDEVNVNPLFAALNAGFCSIEVDVQFKDGLILIGHDADKLSNATATLENVYINPLIDLIKRNKMLGYGAYVYQRSTFLGLCSSINLLIDIKNPTIDAWKSIDALITTKQKDIDYFECYQNEVDAKSGAIRVILTGVAQNINDFEQISSDMLNKGSQRCVSLDFRGSLLGFQNGNVDLQSMQQMKWTKVTKMISDHYASVFQWPSDVNSLDSVKTKIRNYVS